MKNYRPISKLICRSCSVQVIGESCPGQIAGFPRQQRPNSTHSLLLGSSTALRPRCRRCTMICYLQQMRDRCLLDLTAAFDTVDHELLLLRVERQFGLRGTVLQWFRSYLSGRSIRVLYGGSMSSIVYILCSIPQGSVLGPLHGCLFYTPQTYRT